MRSLDRRPQRQSLCQGERWSTSSGPLNRRHEEKMRRFNASEVGSARCSGYAFQNTVGTDNSESRKSLITCDTDKSGTSQKIKVPCPASLSKVADLICLRSFIFSEFRDLYRFYAAGCPTTPFGVCLRKESILIYNC